MGLRWDMKLFESRRSLGLLVASVILIAVVVLGGICVEMLAFWGVLPYGSVPNGGELTLGVPFGWYGGGSMVNITVSSTGKDEFTVTNVLVENINCTFQWAGSGSAGWLSGPAGPVVPGGSVTLEVEYLLGWSAGYSYTFMVVTDKSNEYLTTATCPL